MMKRILILALIAVCGCKESIANQENKLVYSDDKEVYLTNGFGDKPIKILSKMLRGTSPSGHSTLYDSYFHPSLSPDETKITAIRIRNFSGTEGSPELSSIQKSEAVIYDLKTQEEVIFYELPGSSNDEVASPVWSQDGKKVFFLAGNHLLSYDLTAGNTKELSTFPQESRPIASLQYDNYIRLSGDGETLYALLSDAIWQVDISSGDSTRLYGSFVDSIWNKVRKIPDGLPEKAVTALFGSRKFPVMAPKFSSDGSFYSYYMWREGFFANYWIGGYSALEDKEFLIKLIDWRFYAE